MAIHIRRRELIVAVGGAAAAWPVVSRVAKAQAYPSRPVRVVVGAPPGGGHDIIARLIGQQLSERLGQPFVIDNRPGGGENIATEAVVRSSPDGYTILLVTGTNAINTTLYERLSFNFNRDIASVAAIARMPELMVTNFSVPAKTVPEFIAYAKANPSKLNIASGGIGTPSHMAGELFKTLTGVNIQHVPYRGAAPALTDLIAGQVQLYFVTTPASIDYIRTGKLRALAVTTATRSEALPDIPSVSEFVPGYEASAWWGVGAPKDTPADIVETLNKEINATLADPKMKARLADLGCTVLAGSPADFGKLIADETEKWAKVIKFVGVKAD